MRSEKLISGDLISGDLISGDLILGNLVSSEPLDKLCQSGWEGSLDRTAGNP
jgi:hypothetical protein